MSRCLRASSIALALAVLLDGCAVGPDFRRPTAPAVAQYVAPATVASDEATTPRLVPGAEIPAQWWHAFGSAELDALVEHALRDNPSVAAADAALRSAQESAAAQRGALWPSVSADLNASHQKTAPVLSPVLDSAANPYSLQTAQVLVSYTLDVFGGNRRQLEAATAQAESARFQLEAARMALAANVVAGVVQAAALRDDIAATRELITLQSDQLGIMRRQAELGEIAQAAVIAQEAALAQTRALLPALEKQRAQQADALAALAGRLPAEEALPALTLASLQVPAEMPTSLPSLLVERRADVRSAEALLHAASAQVGVATAARLPQITLTANKGSAATQFDNLLHGGSGFFGVAADIAQPIFAGGALLHRQRAAEADLAQAQALYRAAVIGAFQNVADALQALQWDSDGVAAATTAEQATAHSLRIARAQLALGDVSYLAVIGAEQAWQQARIACVQAQASRLADVAALFLALGGGWWNEGVAASASAQAGSP